MIQAKIQIDILSMLGTGRAIFVDALYFKITYAFHFALLLSGY
jgi:hypothetical protein